jgi:lipoprotein NlpD
LTKAAKRTIGLAILAAVLVAGCGSTPTPAPVVQLPQTGAGTAGAPGQSQFYTVKPGDTLYSIARSHGLDYKTLAARNNITDYSALAVGQQLQLTSPQPQQQSGVETTPLQTTPAVQGQPVGGAMLGGSTPVPGLLKTEPKAVKVPYSKQALASLSAQQLPQTGASPNTVQQQQPAAEAGAASAPPVSTAPNPANNSGINWQWPTSGKVVSTFDDSGSMKGIGIAGKMGQPIYASASGKVVYSGDGLRGYGKLVIIKHNKTYLSVYAHNSKLLVKENQDVKRGQKIALMGNSGASQVELHFEIRKLGKPVDPLQLLPKR